MNIKLKDLDLDIISKLNQLDDLKKDYINDPRKTVVSYNGKSFSLVRFPVVDKVEFSENDIADLEIAMKNKKSNCRSSLLEDLRTDDKLHIATKSFFTKASEYPVVQCESNILEVYSYGNSIFTYDTDGMFTKFVNNSIVKSINVPNLIYNVFSLRSGIYSVKNFSIIDEDTVLFITDRGVYRLYFNSEELEFIIPEMHARIVKQLNNDLILCGTDDYIVLYRADSCKKISKFYNIIKDGQIPFKIAQKDNKVFVLCKNIGQDVIDTFLHYYEIDETGLNCEIKDEYICPLTSALNEAIDIKENELYVLNNGKLLVYQLDALEKTPKIISLESKIISFEVVNSVVILLTTDGEAFIYKNNELYDTIKLPGEPNKIFYNSDFYYVNENKLSRFYLPVYQNNSDSLSYRIINDPCNNIDVLIDGIDKDHIVSFYDGESLAVIKPSYYSIYNNKALIKITGCSAKKINMIIPVDSKVSINGFVVRRNHLFLK